MADRGIGILETLKTVIPTLQNDEEALTVAFTKVISGRSPEKRGNGLKYVHKIIIQNPISLVFLSGSAELKIDMTDSDIDVHTSGNLLRGCVVLLRF